MNELMKVKTNDGKEITVIDSREVAITEAAQLMKEAVDDIMVTLNEAASEVGLVGGMVDAIAEAMSKVGLGSQTPSCTP